MFNQDIKNEPNEEKRRNLIRADLIQRISAGRIFLTPVLMEDEPHRTNALEALDGVAVQGGAPQYGAAPRLVDDLPTVRLIAIENTDAGVRHAPGGQIRSVKDRTFVVPGTNHARTERVEVKHGSDKTLAASEARQVLTKYGWPIRDHKSRGNHRGTVVEWEWLKHEAKQPEAIETVRALYASIKDAIEPEAAPNTTAHRPTKGAAEARP